MRLRILIQCALVLAVVNSIVAFSNGEINRLLHSYQERALTQSEVSWLANQTKILHCTLLQGNREGGQNVPDLLEQNQQDFQ